MTYWHSPLYQARYMAAVCMVACALTSCAEMPSSAASRSASSGACSNSNLSPTDNTRLAGIEQLLNEGKFYAALAQLDALGVTSSQTQLVRAEALRRIEKIDEAQAIYLSLVGSCMDGRAKHGLGLTAAKSGQQAASLTYLTQARQALPTDARIRNDLGYALLLAGQYDAAQFEFLTVLDLSPQDPRATHNLVLLTLKQGKTDKAIELAKKLGLDAATIERLKQQALAINPGAQASTGLTVATSGTQP